MLIALSLIRCYLITQTHDAFVSTISPYENWQFALEINVLLRK